MYVKYIHPFKIFISKTVNSAAARTVPLPDKYKVHTGQRLGTGFPAMTTLASRSIAEDVTSGGSLAPCMGAKELFQQHGSKGAILKDA